MNDTVGRITFSPGPWEWFAGKTCGEGHGSMSMKFLKASSGQGFAHTVGLSEPTDTANANLIAAAPDLLAALKALLCSIDELDTDTPHISLVPLADALTVARAAIAKAEGR